MRRQAPPCGHFWVCGRDIFFMGRVPKPTSLSEQPPSPGRGEGEPSAGKGLYWKPRALPASLSPRHSWRWEMSSPFQKPCWRILSLNP